MLCPNCHRENLDSYKFCRYCGAKLPKAPKSSTSSKSASSVSSASDQSAQSSQPSFKFCPNCGAKNPSDATFCIHCGYTFNPGVSSSSTPNQQINAQPQRASRSTRDYSQQWKQANQALNNASNFFADYFVWFINTIKDPLGEFRCGPYFGVISFCAMAIFQWIGTVIGTKVGQANSVAHLLTGYITTSGYNQIAHESLTTFGSLIMAFFSVFLTAFVAFFADRFVSKDRVSLLSFFNSYAGITNLAVIVSLLFLISPLLNLPLLIWLLSIIIPLTMWIGLAVIIMSANFKQDLKINFVYVLLAAIIIIQIIQPLFTSVVSMMSN